MAWEDSPGVGNGNPLHYFCLENPVDRGAWWATVHRVAKNRIRQKQLSTFNYLKGIFFFNPLKQAYSFSLLISQNVNYTNEIL